MNNKLSNAKLYDEKWIERLAITIFDDIAVLTKDRHGVSRETYGKGETDAINYLSKLAVELGLHVEVDDAANVFFSSKPIVNSRYILIGSHMDSVPLGGNFDGLAGVLAGFLILSYLSKNKINLSLPLKVIALRGEESAWYGRNYIGSKAIFGLLTKEDLNSTHRKTGEKLSKAMQSCGVDINKIQSSTSLIDTENIELFIELHIEQGPILVDRNWPAAIVTGIRGNNRHHNIICKGSAGHSGTIPRYLRKDSVFAGADLITRMDDHWNTIQQHGGDLVLTSGIFHTDSDHHAMSRIPGEIFFSFESRSQDVATLDALEALLKSECKTIERERGVKFEFDDLIKSSPAELDEVIIKNLLDAGESLGFERASLPSGAGHDAAVFANVGIKTGMIFVRNDKGSHNPYEAMDIKDFMAGLSILKKFLIDY
ncbi:MAG: Zn-dependent hydrolase [Proteobacteria bacterium]|nr:Zn-dependent hydrolase [Pseudomonadota bacterium]MDA1136579.1 Zn-dependent hydrolase [Pseudomonadota bacterium]